MRGPLPRLPLSLLEKSFMAVPFMCWVFAKHMENGREVFWKMGKGRRCGWWRVAGVADGGSSVWLMMARRRADAGKHHGLLRYVFRIRQSHRGILACRCLREAQRTAWEVRRSDRSEGSPVGSFGKFARQIVWKARRVDRLGSLPSGHSKSSPSGLLGRATEGHCRLAGLIWQKTPPGGLVARLGFWVLQGNSQ